MTRRFWLEGEVYDVADTEDEPKGTNLLGLATKLFWDDTGERTFL